MQASTASAIFKYQPSVSTGLRGLQRMPTNFWIHVFIQLQPWTIHLKTTTHYSMNSSETIFISYNLSHQEILEDQFFIQAWDLCERPPKVIFSQNCPWIVDYLQAGHLWRKSGNCRLVIS